MLVYNPKVLDNIQPLQSNMWVMDIHFYYMISRL